MQKPPVSPGIAKKTILNILKMKGGAASEKALRSAVRDYRAFNEAMLQLIDEGRVYVNYCERPPVIILLDD